MSDNFAYSPKVGAVLVRVLARLSGGAAWTKKALARNSAGLALISACGSHAKCWCIEGAIDAELDGDHSMFLDCLEVVAAAITGHDCGHLDDQQIGMIVWDFNDRAESFQEISLVLTRAIASCMPVDVVFSSQITGSYGMHA